MKKILLYIIAVFLILIVGLIYWFYPAQLMPVGELVSITTPDFQKYKNDIIHPCIRRMSDGRYVLVQSPWYNYTDSIENPIFYISNDPMTWENGIVVAESPEKGYNSDLNVYEENGRIYVFWREVETPICDSMNVRCAVVGMYTDDEGMSFSKKQIYLTCADENTDDEICPILIKKNGKYRFYATWYQTCRQDRHNLGIAIWESSSLEQPNFERVKNVPFQTRYICNMFYPLTIFEHTYKIPQVYKFDLWHFDLFEYDGKLYMVASEEMKFDLMLAVSEDGDNFELLRTPLINSYVSMKENGYPQYYYKPTAWMSGDTLHLFYTANMRTDFMRHQLYHTSAPLGSIIK